MSAAKRRPTPLPGDPVEDYAPLDLTDRRTLAPWLAQVRSHVGRLNALLAAVPEMPFLHVQVFHPAPEPMVTLQHLHRPGLTAKARVLKETADEVKVQATTGEIYEFRRKTGEELPNPLWPGPPVWRLVLPDPPPEGPSRRRGASRRR